MEDAPSAVDPAILRVLRDPSARPQPSSVEAHVEGLVRRRVLERISAALSTRHLQALLVKGAALALTHYPPGARTMSDIDLLVRTRDRDRILEALERDGFVIHRPEGRPLSATLLHEVQLTVDSGAVTSVVEVHTSLDKIVARPLFEDHLFERALPAPAPPTDTNTNINTNTNSLPGLLVPSPEDHALLVALHAAGHEFRHPIAFLDLELLLRAGLDRPALVARAREARLTSVLFVTLAALRALGAASVTGDLVAAFDPGPLRRAAIAQVYDLDAYPNTNTQKPMRLGLPWIARQTPLRDDLAAWTRGVALYSTLRAADRIVSLALSLGRRASRQAKSTP
jgi:hypothetical protein